ncbi:hypothetical protein EMGR_007184 [Emarellia grisea]
MQHSCHFSQHPLAWDISMLEEHPFFAHLPPPPPYHDSFESSSGEPSKCKTKGTKERAKKGMNDEHPEEPEIRSGHSCGRGRRGFHHRHPGLGHHLHPHVHEHDEEHGFSRWFTPPLDVFVTPTHTIIHVSLPGAQRSDLSVAYDASRAVLRMAGVVLRPGVDDEMRRALLIGERGRHLGVFEREMPISHSVAVEGIRARLVDGVLRVALPRVEGDVPQPDEEMDEVDRESASREFNSDGKEEEREVEDEVEREYVKVDIQ